jgi:hypothetical protein
LSTTPLESLLASKSLRGILEEVRSNHGHTGERVGAIAGGVVSSEARAYAQNNGLFVLELNGEQVSLLESPKHFVPLQG